MKTASQYLEKYRPAFMGLDLEKLLAQTEACLLGDHTFPRFIPHS